LEPLRSQQRAPITFQKPIECPSHFSKAAREFQYIHQPKGKNAWKIRKGIQPKGKRNQSSDSLVGFENSNEIQILFEYPT